jgi:hypothetical protein
MPKHDLPAGGKVDEQVNPRLKGLPGKVFPFKDEHIKRGRVTVWQMLQDFRARYTPLEQSGD